MNLPDRFVITIEGDRWRVVRRANIVPNELPHLFGRLLTGNMVAAEAMAAHGLRVSVEEDTDQADDEPDGLSTKR